MERYKKGDLVTYSSGVIKYINKPDRYYRYFDNDYFNHSYNLKIVKIQRYFKCLWFYRLKTIYKDNKN